MDILTKAWIVIDVGCIAIVLSYRFKNDLPGILKDLVTWGKTRDEVKNSDLSWFRKILLVPNRWFIHFYAFGLIWNAYILFTFVHTCLLNHSLPQGVLKFLLFIKGNSHPSGLDCFSILLTLSLITIQMIRRLYESLFVASFSGRIHLGHYIVGLLFYGLVNLTVVAEIPIPLQQGWCNSCLKFPPKISWFHLPAIFLFAWASYHQNKCHRILGKLTTSNPNGKKIYKIPCGDWFEYVSSPHYLAEIIIYVALFFVMQGLNKQWLLVLVFVTSNLSLGATVTHAWYHQKFTSYPKTRSVIIPYIY